jgi:hypothetical protein
MEQNPYAPPVDDLPRGPTPTGDDGFIEGGRGVEAGRGYAWITGGWEIVKGSVGSWILICILYIVLAVALSLIPRVGQLAFSLIAPVLTGGLLIGCRDTREGRDFGVAHFFEGFKQPGGLLVLGLVHLGWALVLGVVGLAFGVGGVFNAQPQLAGAFGNPAYMKQLYGIFTFAGVSWLLGIPITMATYYAPCLVALRGMSPIAALKNSFLGASKNVLPFIVYCVLTFFFSIAAAIPCGLGLLVLVPVLIASVYAGYRDVFFAEEPPQ